MAAQYGALSFTLEEEKKPKASPLRKAGAVAAVVVAVCVMFFAGRVHKSLTTPFTHEEVMNVASTCKPGTFIGGCKKCSQCNKFERKQGGCTMFKDTFCTFCTPIAHCSRTNSRCPKGADTTCTMCTCTKSPTAHYQKTQDDIEYESTDWKANGNKKMIDFYALKQNQYDCFFNGGRPWTKPDQEVARQVAATECRKCTVCPKMFYQSEKCNPAKKKDTQCKPCTVCKSWEYTAEPCSYLSDTKCKNCINCADKSTGGKFYFQSKECSIKLNKDPYATGQPGVCTKCKTAPAKDGSDFTVKPDNWKESMGWFVSQACKPGKYKTVTTSKGPRELQYVLGSASDTQFSGCKGCPKGDYIERKCQRGLKNPFVGGQVQKDKVNSFDDQCLACRKNPGCEASTKSGPTSGVSCPEGRSLVRTIKDGRVMEAKTLFSYRTRRCDNLVNENGDAQYGECKACEDWQFTGRKCAVECKKLSVGLCYNPTVPFYDIAKWVKGGSKTVPKGFKKCTKDSDCPNSFCKGRCAVGKEDGELAKFNQVGAQRKCTNCLSRMLVGKNDAGVNVYKSASFFEDRCRVKDRRCQFAQSAFDVSGNPKPPQFSTCQPSACSDGKQLENYGNCCKDGSLGQSCEFAKKNRQCFLSKFSTTRPGAQGGHPYKMRTVTTGKVAKNGLTFRDAKGQKRKIPLNARGNIFVRWCKELCDQEAECTMFQVKTCLVENTCPAEGKAACQFFADVADAENGAGQKNPKLSEDRLKELKLKGTTWTCADGASVKDNHTGMAEFSNAGFKCPSDAQEVIREAKCESAMCKNDAKKCCRKATTTCFSKSAQRLRFQAESA